MIVVNRDPLTPDDGGGDKANLGIHRRTRRIRRNLAFDPCQSRFNPMAKQGTNSRARIRHRTTEDQNDEG